MIKYIKREIRHLPTTIVMFILLYSITTLAVESFNANQVRYDNTTTETQEVNVQDAIDELYSSASNYTPYNSKLNSMESTVGNSSLTTTAQTVSGAINELDSNIMKTNEEQIISGNKTFNNIFRQKSASDTQYNYLFFYNKNATKLGLIRYTSGSATNVTSSYMSFLEYSPNSPADGGVTGKYEHYTLPAATAGKTANTTYDILTTKSTVTLAQGGTGATTAAAARTALGIASASDVTAAANHVPKSLGSIAKSSSKVLKTTGSTVNIIVTVGAAQSMMGMYIVYMTTSSEPVLVSILAASGVGLKAGTGQMTITNNNASYSLSIRVIPLGGLSTVLSLT